MDPETGKIIIDGVEFRPGYTFEDFKKTPFYTNQDGIRIIPLKGGKEIDAHKFIASLFFRDGKLYMISLACVDMDIPFEEEEKRALLGAVPRTDFG